MKWTHISDPPVALSIAGSDNSAGAGIQADLKTFTAFGVHGLTAVTAVVAEIPGCVERIQAVDPDIVEAQIRLSFSAFPIGAVKTGMLCSAPILATTASALRKHGRTGLQLVVDPVMVASSGDPLLEPQAVDIYKEELFPMAALVTPNLDEVRVLTGALPRNESEMREAGLALVQRYQTAFLMKGGHLGGGMAVDLLVLPDGTVRRFTARFRQGVDTHGSGCTYSAAIAAGLACGHAVEEAVGGAKRFITKAIADSLGWSGHPTQVLNHRVRRRPSR